MARKLTTAEKKQYLVDIQRRTEEMWEDLKVALPPGSVINTVEMRLNIFIQSLIDMGLITDEQKLAFEIKFAEAVEDYMLGLIKEREAQFEAAKKEAAKPKLQVVERPKAPLLGPGGRPIGKA